MSIVDIFNFDEKKIGFSAPINSTSQEGGVSYQKIYLNYQNEKFHFELPMVEMTITKNTKKKYEAYSAKFKLNIAKQEYISKIIECFQKIYGASTKHIEDTKSKLNFKNKAKFKADKAEECGFNNPLYYITDKESGEKTNQPPMIYANLVIKSKNNTTIKYPSGINQFKTLDYLQYLGVRMHCIPVLNISNIFVGNDGDIRLQLQLAGATVIKVIESADFDQSSSFSKYGIDISNTIDSFNELSNAPKRQERKDRNVSIEFEGDDELDLNEVLRNTDD